MSRREIGRDRRADPALDALPVEKDVDRRDGDDRRGELEDRRKGARRSLTGGSALYRTYEGPPRREAVSDRRGDTEDRDE